MKLNEYIISFSYENVFDQSIKEEITVSAADEIAAFKTVEFAGKYWMITTSPLNKISKDPETREYIGIKVFIKKNDGNNNPDLRNDH
ncbi:MAG: hypothetical protein ACK40G_13790 [Cytophagaceae bacterium]